MYFTINMALTIYLDMLPNITTPSIIRDRTMYEQPLPINLTLPAFDTSLKGAPKKLKNFMHNYAKHKEIFDFKQWHVSISFPIIIL